MSCSVFYGHKGNSECPTVLTDILLVASIQMEGGRACRAENNALPLDFGGNYFAIMVMHMFYSKLLYLKVFPILLIKNIAKKDTNDDDLASRYVSPLYLP
jgi:hypothetical protein